MNVHMMQRKRQGIVENRHADADEERERETATETKQARVTGPFGKRKPHADEERSPRTDADTTETKHATDGVEGRRRRRRQLLRQFHTSIG